jgi:hypothetical protein
VYWYIVGPLCIYCSGFTECPTTISFFIIRQQAHFCCKQLFASSCLQIEHIHACAEIISILLCCFDLASTYNHNAITGMPIIKKTMIVRTGILSTNNAIPKIIVPTPRIEIQRVVLSIMSPNNIHTICLPYQLLDSSFFLVSILLVLDLENIW